MKETPTVAKMYIQAPDQVEAPTTDKEEETRKFDLDQINFVLKAGPVLLELYEDWKKKTTSNEDLVSILNNHFPKKSLHSLLLRVGTLEILADEYQQGLATFEELKFKTLPEKLKTCQEILRQLAEINPNFYDQIMTAGFKMRSSR